MACFSGQTIRSKVKFWSYRKVSLGYLLTELSKCCGSTARQHGSVWPSNLVCWFERCRLRVSICHRFLKDLEAKNFFSTLPYGESFSLIGGQYSLTHCGRTVVGSMKLFSDLKRAGSLPWYLVILRIDLNFYLYNICLIAVYSYGDYGYKSPVATWWKAVELKELIVIFARTHPETSRFHTSLVNASNVIWWALPKANS